MTMPGQPETPLHEGIEADRPGLPIHRLLCLQHAFHSIRDRVEVRCPHEPLEKGDVRCVVGIEGEPLREILS